MTEYGREDGALPPHIVGVPLGMKGIQLGMKGIQVGGQIGENAGARPCSLRRAERRAGRRLSAGQPFPSACVAGLRAHYAKSGFELARARIVWLASPGDLDAAGVEPLAAAVSLRSDDDRIHDGVYDGAAPGQISVMPPGAQLFFGVREIGEHTLSTVAGQPMAGAGNARGEETAGNTPSTTANQPIRVVASKLLKSFLVGR